MKRRTIAALGILAAALVAAGPAEVKNVIVYDKAGEFAGWPANEGFWTWDNEILVGFEVAKLKDIDDGHAVDRDSPKRIAFARSLDGGETWTPEEHPEIAPPVYLEDPERYQQVSPGAKAPVEHSGSIDFAHPDFAMKIRATTFYTSTNRGRSWDGPFRLPDFGHRQIMARTNYLVVDKNTCRIFAEFVPDDAAVEAGSERGQTLMAETTDGGKTWKKIAILAPDPYEIEKAKIAYSIMPGLLARDNGTILAAMRQRSDRQRWVELVESKDQGRSWATISKPFDRNNNPGALVPLGGDRLAIVYGFRNVPYGIRARISEDAGKTWGQDIVLRDDARKWDLGYTRAYVRPDGKVVTVYYYNTADRPQIYIAASIWTPPGAVAPTAQAD